MRNRLFGLLFVFLGLMSCEKEKLIEENSLPAAARDFIDLHFGTQEIVQITRERENLTGIEYEVILNDGSEMKFDKSGACYSIDAGHNGIPDSVILPAILEYLTEHYSAERVVEWEKDKKIIKIELSNGLDLRFTQDGDFLKIDS